VVYKGFQNEESEEILTASSKRLAYAGTYTSRNDIPKYIGQKLTNTSSESSPYLGLTKKNQQEEPILEFFE